MSSNTRITPDKVGKIAARVITETAYVITGLADIVAGTVQDVVREGRQTYTERRAAGGNPVADYGKRVPNQVKGLVGELKDAYQSISARGRTVFSDGFSRTAHRRGPEAGDQQPPAN